MISYLDIGVTAMTTPENANLAACLFRISDEIDYTKFHPPLNFESEQRLRFAESGLKKCRQQANKILKFAQETGNEPLLELLGELFEFGADIT
jgi:hypothetical protein